MNIAENIRRIRKERGLTQEELGKLVGLSGVAIMRYEKGQREPKVETLEKIAFVLGVKVFSIMRFDLSEVPTKELLAELERRIK